MFLGGNKLPTIFFPQVRKITFAQKFRFYSTFDEWHLKICRTFLRIFCESIDQRHTSKHTFCIIESNILDCHCDNVLFCHFNYANSEFCYSQFNIYIYRIKCDLYSEKRSIQIKALECYSFWCWKFYNKNWIISNWLWIRKWQIPNKILIF